MAMRQLVKEGVKGKFVHLPVCWEDMGGEGGGRLAVSLPSAASWFLCTDGLRWI